MFIIFKNLISENFFKTRDSLMKQTEAIKYLGMFHDKNITFNAEVKHLLEYQHEVSN